MTTIEPEFELLSLMRQSARAVSPAVNSICPISRDNALGSWTLWEDGDPHQPFAVKLAHHGRFRTLALDFDAGDVGPSAAAAEADVARHLLERAGIASVLTASGPTGGRHVLATIEDDGLSAREARMLVTGMQRLGLATLDITGMTNPATGAIRPPLAPHRHGGRSEPIGMTALEAVETLEARQDPARFRLLAEAMPAPPDRRQPLREVIAGPEAGPGPGRAYHSGSEAVQALAVRMVNRRQSYEDFVQQASAATREPGQLGAAVTKHRDRGDLDRWLRTTWESATTYVAANPPRYVGGEEDEAEVIATWVHHIGSVPNSTARRVGQAIGAIAQQEGRRLVGASVRMLAERAGMSKSSADRGLAWLRGHGALEDITTTTIHRAARYRLAPVDQWAGTDSGTVSPHLLGGVGRPTVPQAALRCLAVADDLSLDMWTDAGLGEHHRQTYRALCHGDGKGDLEAHRSDVASRTGTSVRTASRHLSRLSTYGLARPTGDGRWVIEYRDPADVARACGVEGQQARTRERHAAERRAHAVRQVESRIDYLLAQPRYRHLGGAQTENRSQPRGSSVGKDLQSRIVLPAPGRPVLPDYSVTNLLQLPSFQLTAAASHEDGGMN